MSYSCLKDPLSSFPSPSRSHPVPTPQVPVVLQPGQPPMCPLPLRPLAHAHAVSVAWRVSRCLFSEEHVHMANGYRKRSATSLIVREVHIKTALSCDLTPARMMIIKEEVTSVGEEAGRGALLVGVHAGAVAAENSMEGPQDVKNGATI